MDIMIDLETMGTSARAAILSVGAVIFDPFKEEAPELLLSELRAFYVRVDMRSQTPLREIEPDTVYWWLKQGDAARADLAQPPLFTITDALLALREFIRKPQRDGEIRAFWSHGATFDLPILADAFSQYRIPNPMPYSKQYCCRTITAVANVPRPEVTWGFVHTAVADAVRQAIWVQRAHQKLARGPMSQEGGGE